MGKLFTKTFFSFFFAFLAILSVALGVLVYSSSELPPKVNAVDNVALPN